MIIKTDPDTTQSYLTDSSNLKGGNAEEVVFPSDATELSGFMKDANSKRIPVTVSGGGTGTAGSRIPFGGAVVSMEKFNKISDISETGSSCIVGSGVIVDDLKNACENKGLFYTSHPTERTAFVGGTVATNASGARSFKYGSIRGYVKMLDMILANGERLKIRRGDTVLTSRASRVRTATGYITVPLPTYVMPEVKNSAGYFAKEGMDAIDLFIGQEGTLSVITQMELGLVKLPFKILSSFVFFKKEEDAWDFSKEARSISKKISNLSKPDIDALSIEYFDRNAIRILREKNTNVPSDAESAIFFEQELLPETEDMLVGRWLDLMPRHHASPDKTWVAMTEEEAKHFSDLRHHIPEYINDIVRRRGFPKLSTDISVPESRFPELMAFYSREFRKNDMEHVIFGHIGENHVHVNLLPRSDSELKAAKNMVLLFIQKGVALGGTISAEHGVGKTKHKYLEMMYGRRGIMEMARIKKAFDPNSILGLDNIFPREVLRTI